MRGTGADLAARAPRTSCRLALLPPWSSGVRRVFTRQCEFGADDMCSTRSLAPHLYAMALYNKGK